MGRERIVSRHDIADLGCILSKSASDIVANRREEMYKLRKQGREAQARARNERFCATFPAPGCVRQHIPVRTTPLLPHTHAPPPLRYPAAGPCFVVWPHYSLDSLPLLLVKACANESLLRKLYWMS